MGFVEGRAGLLLVGLLVGYSLYSVRGLVRFEDRERLDGGREESANVCWRMAYKLRQNMDAGLEMIMKAGGREAAYETWN